MSEERKLQEKEELLRQKLKKIHAMEQEIQEKEKNLRLREKSKSRLFSVSLRRSGRKSPVGQTKIFVPSTDRSNFFLRNVSGREKKAVIPNDYSKQAETKGREARPARPFPFLSERSVKMGQQAPGDT